MKMVPETALVLFLIIFFCYSLEELKSLKKGICGGSLQAAGYVDSKEKYLQKIDKISKSIRFKIIK